MSVASLRNRLELVEVLLQGHNFPDRALRAIFDLAIQESRRSLSDPVYGAVWQNFSKERLRILQEKYLIAISNTLLYDESRIQATLEEARTHLEGARNKIGFSSKRKRVEDSLIQELAATSITDQVNQSVSEVELVFKKRELARVLLPVNREPEKSLRFVFNTLRESYDRLSTREKDPTFWDRVWQRGSPAKWLVLNEAYLFDFCRLVLGEFDERQVDQMLQLGVRPPQFARINQLYQQQAAFLRNANIELATSQAGEWVSNIKEVHS